MKYRTLRENISYNLACNILEKNHYGVTDTKQNNDGDILFIDRMGRVVAKYNEEHGALDVICN